MPLTHPDHFHSQVWLESPISTPEGELQLAGALSDVPGLDPNSMRVLGSYSFIYIVKAKGYYADIQGVRRNLRDGDLVVIFPELAHAYGPRLTQKWDQIYCVFNGPQFDFLRERGLLDPQHPIWHLEPVDYWRRRFPET